MSAESVATLHETRSGRESRSIEHPPREDDLVRLSNREKQVLGLVAKGLHAADVARILDISAHTVCTHVKSIYRKRNLCSRAEAALEAQRLGLI
jgi:DNA-binding CsgD family transcriptional regulator